LPLSFLSSLWLYCFLLILFHSPLLYLQHS
jgi:hypothetical protein